MAVTAPGPDTRWRCTACGNLTRFDVELIRHTREFVHVDLAGQPRVEEQEVLAEQIERVVCRWCGADRVDVVARP